MMLNNIAAAVKALEPLSEQLMAVTEDQVAASQQQSVAAQQVAATSKQIAASSSAMSRKAEEVSEVADQTSASSQKGRAYMGEVITQMKEIKTRVSNVASSIIELGEQSGQIGTVVDIIKEISEQTNLLALNASIEAAGAGEAGKRFTIVAGEVRRLATNTLEATKMIRQRVESIQRLANKVVLLTEEEIKTVDVGAKTINEMGHQFGIIMTMVDGSSRAATEIKSGTLQQSMASDQMASALTEVSQTVAQSEKGVKEIGLAVDELKRVIKELNSLTTSKN
jgi:methyl-accepting chemotaxis protein